MEYPQVALDFMNRDHAEFVSLRNSLIAFLGGNSPDAEVDALLTELLAHTKHHFAEEERQMQATHFPPYRMHKMEHDRVIADMELHGTNWMTGRDRNELKDWLENDVATWFVNHVSTMDMVTAHFITAQAKV